MGGFGSGRPPGAGRGTVEGCLMLDVNRLHRAGHLEPGRRSTQVWTRGGAFFASVGVRAEEDLLRLEYRVTRRGGSPEDVEQTVRLARFGCHLGGARPYFICPRYARGIACGRRVATLHMIAGAFACRRCSRLVYASQREDPWGRALRRAAKTRSKLGEDKGPLAPLPLKPKGMWWRTYDLRRARALEAQAVADEYFVARAERLLGRAKGVGRRGRSAGR